MGTFWPRKGDTMIAICVQKTLYGRIGDMAPLTDVIYSDKTWSHVSELVKSGAWRMTNDIEAAAFNFGHKSMFGAWEFIGPIRGGLWQQIQDQNRHLYTPPTQES